MADVSTLILDFLSIAGGGRGPALNQVAPYVLGAIFWGILAFVFYFLSDERRNSTDSLLLASFIILFLTGLSQTASHLILADGFEIAVPAKIAGIWSYIDILGSIIGRLLICAAFLQIILGQRDQSVQFLKVSAGIIILAVIYDHPSFWLAILGNSDLEKIVESAYIPYLSHLFFTLLFGFAFYISLRSLRKIRWPILIALCCFLLDSVLSIVVMQPDLELGPILNPIRGNLRLWSIPFIAYVALRIRHVEGQRLEHGIRVNERLEALGQLSSGIAHDFNNHLQIILGYTELALANDDLDKKQRLPLDKIQAAAESAGALVNQLLTFSRGQPPKFERVDLNKIITRLTPVLSRLLGPNIRLKHDLDHDAKNILGDVSMIEQIIINLVVNSKDAINGNGTISIELRSLTRHDANRYTGEAGYERTQLLVSDTGMGIDKKTIDRVFEPFFTTKPVGEGTGLGLATVYSTVKKHNGTSFIKSEPGKFTRVYLEFPVYTGPASPDNTPAMVQPVPTVHGETVLLAEDETSIRDLAQTVLQRAGYNVLVARDGQQAISIVNTYKNKIDLCLFDVTMPIMNGYDTYDRVAAKLIDTPVLFITGNTSRVAHVRRHLPHLQKPFSAQSLSEAVHHAMNEALNSFTAL